ncbi:MAG: hypothetical protein GWN58_15765, partial [Anaerolineae bacterium]|nr:hypothetical protein [Thermoplasmata archaeon]NIV30889.1 hypothetical protein [Anaerolineae bacterium]NIY06635.1 hypothetical protein [Thermoplasmata archaeon]
MITFVSIALKGKHSDKATLVDLDVAMRLSGRRLFGINGSHGGDATYVAFNDPRAARPV